MFFLFISLFQIQLVITDTDLSYWLDNESLNINVSAKYGDVLHFWFDGITLEAGVVVQEPVLESVVFDLTGTGIGDS